MKLKIQEQRTNKKWSIRKLSLISGVARGYISELENDIHENPGIKVMCKIRRALDCTLDDLVSCEEENNDDRN